MDKKREYVGVIGNIGDKDVIIRRRIKKVNKIACFIMIKRFGYFEEIFAFI
jgi:hypothetical protein